MRLLTRVGAIAIVDVGVARIVRLGVAWKVELFGRTVFLWRP